MNKQRLHLIIVLIFLGLSANSQVYSNDAGTREKAFIYRVQQIDEFIARFNNDETSFIRSVYKKQNVPYKINRSKSVKSLFNFEGNWSEDDISTFIKTVDNNKEPIYLSFTDKNWYADVACLFSSSTGNITIQIRLKVITNSIGSKWSIIGVKNHAPVESNTNNPVFTNNPHKYITPTSHNNDFISLSHAFDDKKDLNCYFEKSFFADKTNLSFYNAVLLNSIKFLHVSKVKYYFLQVPTYVVIVENFIRDSLNSGWLISRVDKADATSKSELVNTLTNAN